MTALILRGAPGSGKSTLVEKLKSICWDKEISVHSTDSFFMKDREYVFDPGKLGEYHQANLDAFKASILMGTDLVIVDNTSTRNWEYEKYAQFAKDNNRKVIVVRFLPASIEEHLSRNSHNVPRGVIEKMIENLLSDSKSDLVDVQHDMDPHPEIGFNSYVSAAAEMLNESIDLE